MRLLGVLLFVAGCSCSKSHGGDGGMPDAGFRSDATDTSMTDGGLDALDGTEMDADVPDTVRPDAGLLCGDARDSFEWLDEPEMPTLMDTRVVLRTSSSVLLMGSGLAGSRLLVYDPETRTWARNRLEDGNNATGTSLASGDVLLVGSIDRSARDMPPAIARSSARARLYSDTGEELRRVADMHISRGFHSAVLLDDGQVLVAGGWHHQRRDDPQFATPSAEVFDPEDETWTEQADMSVGRWAFSLTKLNDGRVLAVGGFDGSGPDATRLATAEIYNPLTRSWTAASNLAEGRAWHEAQILPSGRVLVVGGENQAGEVLASSEIYDPVSDTWSSAPSLPEGAEDMASLVLPSGRVLVAGGFGRSMTSTMASVDQVNLYDEGADCWQRLPPLNTARWHFGLAQLPDGRIMVPGGWTDRGPSGSVEVSSITLE